MNFNPREKLVFNIEAKLNQNVRLTLIRLANGHRDTLAHMPHSEKTSSNMKVILTKKYITLTFFSKAITLPQDIKQSNSLCNVKFKT